MSQISSGSGIVQSQEPAITIHDLPGNVYSLLGEFLGEKLPLIIFTNRTSFKVSLNHQLKVYDLYIEQASNQL
jgi:hypothetical protein